MVSILRSVLNEDITVSGALKPLHSNLTHTWTVPHVPGLDCMHAWNILYMFRD